MTKQELMLLARSLKGAGMSILFVMAGLGKPLGVTELATLTGYSKPSVGQALNTLAELGFAQSHSRYHGWMLTNQVSQLPINPGLLDSPVSPEPNSNFSHSEVKNFALRSSSSSNLLLKESSTEKLLLLQDEVKNFYLDLVELLKAESCSGEKASNAICTAIERGDSLEDIEQSISAWLTYCHSDKGASIQSPGFFIASRIESGEPCPTQPSQDDRWIR